MLSLSACDQMVDYVRQAETDPQVKALIGTGRGTVFCAGGTNSHWEILDVETADQLWSIDQPYARQSISALRKKISGKRYCNYSRLFSAAATDCSIRVLIVMGPTPPGTGV